MNTPKDTKTEIIAAVRSVLGNKNMHLTDDTSLIGGSGVLDSMKLVELCILLEDLAEDIGFEFDWTSPAALSKSKSMFRTAGALISEFESQMESKK